MPEFEVTYAVYYRIYETILVVADSEEEALAANSGLCLLDQCPDNSYCHMPADEKVAAKITTDTEDLADCAKGGA
tara:strand:+ start:902 stop:1126 length:225 start_codon:yes stop_codon:yes gene_type:complete